MTECFRCGISDERERLFDAISNKGVVKICRNCAGEEGLPLVQSVDLNKPEKVKTVYERLSQMANLDPEKHRSMLLEKAKQDSTKNYKLARDRRQETTLKGVIDSNLQKTKPQPRTDLIPNYHWVIMRSRRAKKLTQKQLAENIGESEASIISAESGRITNDSDSLVRKLENYLGIKIRNTESPYSSEGSKFVKSGMSEDPAAKEARERFEREGKFDGQTTEVLTIADLQEIKKKKESEGKGFFSFLRRKKKKEEENSDEKTPEGEEDLSKEESDKILYGK
jgi:ribosome-binding protein aMBF1 (putative translation factor)